jgi:hypothetical protein
MLVVVYTLSANAVLARVVSARRAFAGRSKVVRRVVLASQASHVASAVFDVVAALARLHGVTCGGLALRLIALFDLLTGTP